MRSIAPILIVTTAWIAPSLDAEDSRSRELQAIPIAASFSADLTHLERLLYPGNWGRVEFLVVTESGTSTYAVLMRCRDLMAKFRSEGQDLYRIEVATNESQTVIGCREAGNILSGRERLLCGQTRRLVQDMPGWRWHKLQLVRFQGGDGSVVDDDGVEKEIQTKCDVTVVEQEKFAACFGSGKEKVVEICWAGTRRLYVFAPDKCEKFGFVNMLLVDCE